MDKNIKIGEFAYPTTMDIVVNSKASKNKAILAENSILENRKKEGCVNYIGAKHLQNNIIMVEAVAEKAISERCFLNSLNTIFVNALPLDESFKNVKTEFLKSYFDKVLIEAVDVSSFMNTCSGKSKMLKKIVEGCKKTGSIKKSKVAEEAISKDRTSKSDISKQIESDEDLISIDKYDSDEVASIIKTKVSNVVQVEKENNEKDMDMVEEITNQKALGENVSVVRMGIEEHTLFKSIMINNCKQTINETTKNGNSIEGYSTLNESGEISIDMDTMLMETVTEYTRLELFNTMKISNHTVKDMKKTCNEIAYQNKSMIF